MQQQVYMNPQNMQQNQHVHQTNKPALMQRQQPQIPWQQQNANKVINVSSKNTNFILSQQQQQFQTANSVQPQPQQFNMKSTQQNQHQAPLLVDLLSNGEQQSTQISTQSPLSGIQQQAQQVAKPKKKRPSKKKKPSVTQHQVKTEPIFLQQHSNQIQQIKNQQQSFPPPNHQQIFMSQQQQFYHQQQRQRMILASQNSQVISPHQVEPSLSMPLPNQQQKFVQPNIPHPGIRIKQEFIPQTPTSRPNSAGQSGAKQPVAKPKFSETKIKLSLNKTNGKPIAAQKSVNNNNSNISSNPQLTKLLEDGEDPKLTDIYRILCCAKENGQIQSVAFKKNPQLPSPNFSNGKPTITRKSNCTSWGDVHNVRAMLSQQAYNMKKKLVENQGKIANEISSRVKSEKRKQENEKKAILHKKKTIQSSVPITANFNQKNSDKGQQHRQSQVHQQLLFNQQKERLQHPIGLNQRSIPLMVSLLEKKLVYLVFAL